MPDVQITIGGRSFEVSCQEGEEAYLQYAAGLLDAEAATLVAQIGRLPEARMLLMAGLMLADKTAGLQEQLQEAQTALAESQKELETLQSAPAPEPEKVEVPVIPNNVLDSMAELAARAEAIAETVEKQSAG